MPKITPTTAELPILRAALNQPGVDPIFWGVVVGTKKGPQPVIDVGWTHAAGRHPGPGPTVQCIGLPDEEGDVEIPTATGHAVLDEPGPLALGTKIIEAVGELPNSNRQFSLEFSFRECGLGPVE
jgi:hypothetical protein